MYILQLIVGFGYKNITMSKSMQYTYSCLSLRVSKNRNLWGKK